MKAHEENMSESKKVESEVPPGKLEMKVPPRPKFTTTNLDKTPQPPASPIGKITLQRQSTDSPTRQSPNYEIINTTTKHLDIAQLSPTVNLLRCDSMQSPREKALNNGLDPMGMDLISQTTSSLSAELSEKSDELMHSPKISREMKNLQKSTNDSKILSNYLTTSESPRRSRKTVKEMTPTIDPIDIEDQIEVVIEDEEEEEPKDLPEDSNDVENGGDSDATEVLPMEPPQKRRKSFSRNRSRSIVRSRQKSVARMMKDELSATSDKEAAAEDEYEDEDISSEVSYVTNRSIEGRNVNPPPKVSNKLDKNFLSSCERS